jgi:uncharacterized protein (TIGR00369 family)
MTAMTDPTFADLAALMPFATRCGIQITAAKPEEVTGAMPWAEDLCTGGGILHGGSLMTMADSLGAACAFLNLPPGAGTTTVESKTNFFRAVRSGTVTGTARPLHVGRTVIVVQTELAGDDGKPVALVTQTQLVLSQ